MCRPPKCRVIDDVICGSQTALESWSQAPVDSCNISVVSVYLLLEKAADSLNTAVMSIHLLSVLHPFSSSFVCQLSWEANAHDVRLVFGACIKHAILIICAYFGAYFIRTFPLEISGLSVC